MKAATIFTLNQLSSKSPNGNTWKSIAINRFQLRSPISFYLKAFNPQTNRIFTKSKPQTQKVIFFLDSIEKMHSAHNRLTEHFIGCNQIFLSTTSVGTFLMSEQKNRPSDSTADSHITDSQNDSKIVSIWAGEARVQKKKNMTNTKISTPNLHHNTNTYSIRKHRTRNNNTVFLYFIILFFARIILSNVFVFLLLLFLGF